MALKLQDWILKYGTPALQRAQKEGYAVERGAAELVLEKLSAHLGMDLYFHADWESSGERTSPYPESFARRDAVREAVEKEDLPEGWHIEISRISRVTLPDKTHFTGVLLEVRLSKRLLLTGALDFEGAKV